MAAKTPNVEVNGRKLFLGERAKRMAVTYFGGKDLENLNKPQKKPIPPEITKPIELRKEPPVITIPKLKEIPLIESDTIKQIVVNDPLLSAETEKPKEDLKVEPEKPTTEKKAVVKKKRTTKKKK